jgi:hypothetical protein
MFVTVNGDLTLGYVVALPKWLVSAPLLEKESNSFNTLYE